MGQSLRDILEIFTSMKLKYACISDSKELSSFQLGWSFVFAVVADVITVLEMFPLGWAMVYINDKGDQEFELIDSQPRRNRRTRNDRY